MANTKIKILRGLKKDLPLLDRGEIAFCTDTEELFAGDGEKNLLLSLSKEQFDELYKTTEAQEIPETEVVVPSGAIVNSGIPFTKEILENITISMTQHALFGDLAILVDGVPQEDYITWEDRGGYFYLNVHYPNEGISFNWAFVYEDGEYGWWGYTEQGDILDTAILGSTTFLISANVSFSIDRQFVLLDETYKKNEVDTKLDTLETSKQDKLVAGNNITIDPDTNVISASGGEVDLNSMAYFNYASRIYGDKYSLLVSAWEHSLTVDVVDKDHYPNGETEGVIIPQGVTSIDYGAFSSWWSNKQPLIIPNSVTSIGMDAFSGWSANEYPLIIPNSVTSIGTGAFFEWSSNNHPLIIPSSVTSIGEAAFLYWSSVPYVEIKATTPPTLANTNAFEAQNNAPIYVPDESVEAYKTATNWVDLADRIFPISDKVVSDSGLSDRLDAVESGKQDKLTAGDNITIDEDTNVISASGGGDGIDLNKLGYMNYAADIFYRGGHSSLFASAWEHSLTVDPEEISEDSDFSSPRGIAQYPNGEIEGVIIPQGVTGIGDNAFNSWTSNNQPLVIPNSVTSINDEAFSNWHSNNQPLTIPNSVTSIGSGAFFNWPSNNQPLVIPSSVTSIGTYAFSNWQSNNQPLVISNSITNIRTYAFSNWSSNNQPLVIPDSVTNIGEGAFYGWESNNQPLIIPDSVTYISSMAFGNWSLVPYVEIQATTPPTLENINAFDEQNNAPIYVPDESVDDYKAATNWVDLADRIFSINDKE